MYFGDNNEYQKSWLFPQMSQGNIMPKQMLLEQMSEDIKNEKNLTVNIFLKIHGEYAQKGNLFR